MPRTYQRRDPIERFFSMVDAMGDCWEWTGHLHRLGYGQFAPSHGVNVSAHKFAYEALVGAVPDGLELDHLCRNRGCVNPDHLEPVTHSLNVQRAWWNRSRTNPSCRRGHPFTPENTGRQKNGSRYCKACEQQRRIERKAA